MDLGVFGPTRSSSPLRDVDGWPSSLHFLLDPRNKNVVHVFARFRLNASTTDARLHPLQVVAAPMPPTTFDIVCDAHVCGLPSCGRYGSLVPPCGQRMRRQPEELSNAWKRSVPRWRPKGRMSSPATMARQVSQMRWLRQWGASVCGSRRAPWARGGRTRPRARAAEALSGVTRVCPIVKRARHGVPSRFRSDLQSRCPRQHRSRKHDCCPTPRLERPCVG